ncbi:MAG: metallophosphatase, partial [Alistipes sp.]|nr:metallophosphatase [Alistipes sp.]
MRNFLRLACVVMATLMCTTSLWAQTSTLRFNNEKKFKIVQFTDIHWIYNNPDSDIAGERMREVLDTER